MSSTAGPARKTATSGHVARKTTASGSLARKSAPESKSRSTAPQYKSAEEKKVAELTDRLLALRRHGRPPFLVRNLRYVALDKANARRRLWDLNWGSPNVRAAHTPRHLVLHVLPRRCILEKGSTAQLLHPGRLLAPRIRGKPYPARYATLRVWLAVKISGASYVSFGLRNTEICVWPREHLDHGLKVMDFSIQETFDLSAAIALLGSFPAALTLIVEVFSEEDSAKIPNSSRPRLRGELCILDRETDQSTVVPNGKVLVPLYFAATDAGELPIDSVKPRLGFVPPTKLRREDVHHGDVLLPGEDVEMVEKVDTLGDSSGMDDEVTEVGRSRPEMGRTGPEMKLKSTRNQTRRGGSSSRPPHGNIVLELEGTVHNAIKELQSEDKPRIHVTVWYSSQVLPVWDGLVRHDFVCPWCHRNCYRFRTLLAHFQVEHDELEFGVEGISNMPGTVGDGKKVPIVFRLEVTPIPEKGSRRKISEKEVASGWEDVYANPRRFRGYIAPVAERRSEVEVQAAMEKVKISDEKDEDVMSGTTDSDDDGPKEFLTMLNENLWSLCKLCQLRFKKPGPDNHARGSFCSEYCEMMYSKKMAEGDSSDDESDERRPLMSYSTRPRPKSVNYKESLGKLELYHIVSVCRAKEEHFDENDPDSEEEVDSSWRLDLSLERVRHLDDASPKEKLLFMLWNKFAHENYPIPSVYAERYTRFTVELFALEYGPQIHRLKLRLQLVGFLRALHIHGLIDSEAILSTMLCLDGKKKRRDINISSRPDEPKTTPGASSNNRAKTAARRGRGRGGRR